MKPLLTYLLVIGLCSSTASTARAGLLGLQAADLTLGRTENPAASFYKPASVAVDPVSKKVYVSDSAHHRVLRFPSGAALAAGTSAEAVLGQPDLVTITSGLTQGKMSYPGAIACDATGHLWVVDEGNGRVLRFDGAAAKSSGALANGVLGQANFTSSASNISATQMMAPSGIAVYNNDIYISDSLANRVLRFANAALMANGAAAQTVFGQPEMTAGAPGTTSNNLTEPSGLAIQPKADTLILWVADTGNQRVLGFEFPADFPVSTGASKLLGRNSYIETGFGSAKIENLGYPTGISFGGGSLYVSDKAHHRIMRWDSPDTKWPGAAASAQYGQPTFLSESADTFRLDGSEGVTLDATGSLWIADTLNDRVLRYNSPKLKSGDDPADLILWPKSESAARVMGTSIAIDADSGKVFVSENLRNRVLRYASYASLQSGAKPEAVLGQANFTATGRDSSATGMYGPSTIVCAAGGRLWVADTYNDRVLRFDQAATKPTGSPADGVLGETTFGSAVGTNCTDKKFNGPTGLAVDDIGTLWVADSLNNRVLRFGNAHLKLNGGNADGVLGQSGFFAGGPGVSNRYMNNPYGLTVSPEGRLWVFDCGNNRVLRFENAALKPVWGTADGVLGQTDFDTAGSGTDGSHFYSPTCGSLALDSTGRLYVGEQVNHRILWFNAAAQKPNGAAATWILGQNDLDDQFFLFDERHFGFVTGMSIDPTGALWITDGNHDRVLRFTPSTPSLSNSGLDSNQRFFMSINTSPRSSYQIETSSDLTTWTPTGASQKAVNNSLFWIDTENATGKKFYRVHEISN